MRHLSYSQVALWQKCQRQHYYRYIRQILGPPSSAMALGSAVDAACNHNYREKMRSGQDEPLSVLTDVFNEDFTARCDEVVWEDEDPNAVEKDGLILINLFRQELAPRTNPVAVQKKYVIDFGEDYSFLAYADVLSETDAGKIRIIDNKTSTSNFSEARIVRDDQLTNYAACHFAATGEEAEVAFDLMVRGKNPAAVRHKGERNQRDYLRWWRTVESTWRGIEAAKEYNSWLPAAVLHGKNVNWVCLPKYCPYWDVCHKEF